jgi:hypothetical protein
VHSWQKKTAIVEFKIHYPPSSVTSAVKNWQSRLSFFYLCIRGKKNCDNRVLNYYTTRFLTSAVKIPQSRLSFFYLCIRGKKNCDNRVLNYYAPSFLTSVFKNYQSRLFFFLSVHSWQKKLRLPWKKNPKFSLHKKSLCKRDLHKFVPN